MYDYQGYLDYQPQSALSSMGGVPFLAASLYTANVWDLRLRVEHGDKLKHLNSVNENIDKLSRQRGHKQWTDARSDYTSRRVRANNVAARGSGAVYKTGSIPFVPLKNPGSVRDAAAGMLRQTRGRIGSRGMTAAQFAAVEKDKMVKGLMSRNTTYAKNFNAIKSAKRWYNTFDATTLVLMAASGGMSLARSMQQSQVASNIQDEFNNTMPTMLDNERTYTGRQRALLAIHNSQLHAKAVLGQESNYFVH